MNEKDVSHPFMTMTLTCVTMVGWADVPDSDRVTSDVGVPSAYLVGSDKGFGPSRCHVAFSIDDGEVP